MKVGHWITISTIPALIGCLDYILFGHTIKGELMFLVAWMIMFYL